MSKKELCGWQNKLLMGRKMNKCYIGGELYFTTEQLSAQELIKLLTQLKWGLISERSYVNKNGRLFFIAYGDGTTFFAGQKAQSIVNLEPFDLLSLAPIPQKLALCVEQENNNYAIYYGKGKTEDVKTNGVKVVCSYEEVRIITNLAIEAKLKVK